MQIDLLVCDVDGTLTSGDVTFSDQGGTATETKSFSIKDGLVLKVLPRLGLPVVFLTGRRSTITERRGRELDVVDIIQGAGDKRTVLERYLAERGVSAQNVAYFGDDLNDYAAMRSCGFRACPSDAVPEIRDLADYVSPFAGGRGAGRDVCEHILKQTGRYARFLELFGAGAS